MTQQRVVITAGAAGIGYATVTRFLSAGAKIAICDVDERRLNTVKEKHAGVITAVVDVSSSTAVNKFIDDVESAFGGLDVLVNNAGIAGPAAAMEDIDDANWTQSFDVNIHGTFYMMRAVVPIMKRQKSGCIVNISTGSTFTLPINRSPYIASKWAVEGLTRAAARELGPHNIRVNAIRPGFVDSERMRGIIGKKADDLGMTYDALEQQFCQFISMRSKVQPEEIGDMAVFLASDNAKHITGQFISVDGNIEWEQ